MHKFSKNTKCGRTVLCFLNPLNDSNKRYIADYKYVTKYTYSQYEASAARRFIEHAVPVDNLPKISNSTEMNKLEADKVARFKQLASALNLSRYNYILAYQNRVAQDGGVSKMDKEAMLIQNAQNGGLESMKSGTLKGMKLYLLNQMNINRYLSVELKKYEQRNNDLLATYVSLRQATPTLVHSMK